jgi:ubiquitin carboxyl-terminal hydrolase 25/28
MQDLDHTPTELQSIVMEERARFRHTIEDQEKAIRTLGFGKDGDLCIDFESDVPERFILDAWRDCVRRAWRDVINGTDLQREANESFRIVAETRESAKLWAQWESGSNKTMNPERAYDTLEIPKEVDDAMLLTVFVMRVRLDALSECVSLCSRFVVRWKNTQVRRRR